MSKRSDLLASLLLVPASLLVLLLGLELFFRFVAPAPDIPAPAFIDDVLRHEPGQRGVYWSAPFGQEDVRAPFAINAQGWNSARADYPQAHTPGRLRIGVIGDSYVEALQVPPDASIAENMERELGADAEVFRYGVSGAPLSQYLHMARKAVLPSRPDVLVVLLIHNDFDESWRNVPGMYTKSFLRLNLGQDGSIAELPPEPYRQGLLSLVRNHSATWRYLAYGRQARFETLRELLLPRGKAVRHQANIDISALAGREPLDRRATRYLFGRLAAEAAQAGAKLLLVMDGVRGPIEAGSPDSMDYGSGALSLNAMAAEEASLLGIAFLDLHPAFAEDFRQHHRAFAFKTDGHWNAHAHALAARVVAVKLRELGWTTPTPQ
ncbi:MAG: SGNH/GDSL hydrolase family protein [Humidesulfovibrio sp.]|uniref:SGNH/GDSL hydrolase family protein n=1 Tax=Humidesulfovibrio sp. TaxID=2910988 RepID=UPI0027FA4337|nr:SGNH/GDSL hydrolase family protein [Humidesulfovibrio sp.]MDQ7835058.1 SGNH/GDSL hydrolase family protein [Humidesulfovibrio sp.]